VCCSSEIQHKSEDNQPTGEQDYCHGVDELLDEDTSSTAARSDTSMSVVRMGGGGWWCGQQQWRDAVKDVFHRMVKIDSSIWWEVNGGFVVM